MKNNEDSYPKIINGNIFYFNEYGEVTHYESRESSFKPNYPNPPPVPADLSKYDSVFDAYSHMLPKQNQT